MIINEPIINVECYSIMTYFNSVRTTLQWQFACNLFHVTIKDLLLNEDRWSIYILLNWVIIGASNGWCQPSTVFHGPLTRSVKLRVAHAPGMQGTFSPPPWVSDPDMYHGMCVTHVPWCMPESLTSGFLWSRWQGKRSRHSQCMRIAQFYVSGKRPMLTYPLRPQK